VARAQTRCATTLRDHMHAKQLNKRKMPCATFRTADPHRHPDLRLRGLPHAVGAARGEARHPTHIAVLPRVAACARANVRHCRGAPWHVRGETHIGARRGGRYARAVVDVARVCGGAGRGGTREEEGRGAAWSEARIYGRDEGGAVPVLLGGGSGDSAAGDQKLCAMITLAAEE
jgi:hypothetical protein